MLFHPRDMSKNAISEIAPGAFRGLDNLNTLSVGFPCDFDIFSRLDHDFISVFSTATSSWTFL